MKPRALLCPRFFCLASPAVLAQSRLCRAGMYVRNGRKVMTGYLIKEKLERCTEAALFSGEAPFVAILTPEEWKKKEERFSLEIEPEEEPAVMALTRALVRYDSLTGSIAVPQMGDPDHEAGKFAFGLDERGIVFVDGGTLALHITEAVAERKRWRVPGMERFLYDFLEQIIAPDQSRLNRVELLLEKLEDEILNGEAEPVLAELNEVRGNLLEMDLHYSQLLDLGQELEENENEFFAEENLRYFHMFSVRVERLREMVSNLRDYSVQLRDLIQTRVDVKQNRIMTLLTVITTIFTPLTLLTGWYGMNFRYMPELEYKWSYPVVILVSLAIALGCLAYFKKKKWL